MAQRLQYYDARVHNDYYLHCTIPMQTTHPVFSLVSAGNACKWCLLDTAPNSITN